MSGGDKLINMDTAKEYKLFVGDLDENCNEKILLQNFSKYGTQRVCVQKAKKKRFQSDNQDRYYGIVYFDSQEKVEKAKEQMDQQVILNNRIRVCIFKGYFDRVNNDIFLKGVGNLSSQQIKEAFTKFGAVFSVKIAQEKSSGSSLNYGYLSFNDKESRDNCINELKDTSLQIQNHNVEVSKFTPYNKREKQQTNIYIKNLPGNTENFDENKITQLLQCEAKKHGNVLSLKVAFNDKFQKHIAFICYDNSDDAKKAYEQLGLLEIESEKVEINWAQKKEERSQIINQNMKSNTKKTNVFMKNLLDTVDESQVRQVFEQFGLITKLCVQKPEKIPSHISIRTQMGFVNYQNEQMAAEAINASKDMNNQQIKQLFVDGNPQICYHKNKQQMSSNNNKNQGNHQNLMQMMTQMQSNPFLFMQTMQQMMMMNMNMNKGNNGRNMRNMGMMNFNKQQQPMMNQQMPQQMMNQQMQMGGMQMQIPQMMMQQNVPQQINIPQMGGQQVQMNLMRQQQQQQQPQVPTKLTPQSLKENLNEFLKYDQEKQRSLLGELLFPLVNKATEEKFQVLAPKITGMLIDFDVFEVSEILEFLENEELLKERISEAIDLINQSNS